MLLVKLVEPPCTERYARWCDRSGNLFKFPSYSIARKEALCEENRKSNVNCVSGNFGDLREIPLGLLERFL